MAEALKNYRRTHGLKQENLAEMLGVTQPTLSRWEKGTSRPSIGQRRRIGDMLRRPQGLSLTHLQLMQVHLDPNPTNLSENGIWRVCNPAARLSFLKDSLHLLGQDVTHAYHLVRRKMVQEITPAILRGEIIGGECITPLLDSENEPLWARGVYLCYNEVYAVHDGARITTTRMSLVSAQELAASGRKEGWRCTTLDDLLSDIGPISLPGQKAPRRETAARRGAPSGRVVSPSGG